MATSVTSVELDLTKERGGAKFGEECCKVLDEEHLIPLACAFHVRENYGTFNLVLDYYGVRYHLLLRENVCVESCEENRRLQEVKRLLEEFRNVDMRLLRKSINRCASLFWCFVARRSHQENGKMVSEGSLEGRFHRKVAINIQLATGADGILSVVSHDLPCPYLHSDPIQNPCPASVPVFARDEIKVVEQIAPNVFKVIVRRATCCLKIASKKQLALEVAALLRIGHHPHLLSPLIGVVDAGKGKIDQFVTPFVEGRRLTELGKSSLDLKSKWKQDVREAIATLHKCGIAWGDGHENNILIERGSDRAVVIDFGNGCCTECDGFDESKYQAMKEYDLDIVERICRYIDNLGSMP